MGEVRRPRHQEGVFLTRSGCLERRGGGVLEEQETDWEAVDNDEVNSNAVSTDEEGERSTEASSVGMSDEEEE